MSVEYVVLQAIAEQGPFARVSAHKLNQSWNTLQEALDGLGQRAWDLCTTIHSATKERSGPGEHYGEWRRVYCHTPVLRHRRTHQHARVHARGKSLRVPCSGLRQPSVMTWSSPAQMNHVAHFSAAYHRRRGS